MNSTLSDFSFLAIQPLSSSCVSAAARNVVRVVVRYKSLIRIRIELDVVVRSVRHDGIPQVVSRITVGELLAV